MAVAGRRTWIRPLSGSPVLLDDQVFVLELVLDLFEAIYRCLPLDPGQQVGHTLPEWDLWLKAQQAPGLGDIGITMADVPGAELVPNLGLDLITG